MIITLINLVYQIYNNGYIGYEMKALQKIDFKSEFIQ